MNRTFFALLVTACGSPDEESTGPQKIYVCAQNVGQVEVFDGAKVNRTALITVGETWMPHNVDIGPDGRVFVTSADKSGAAADELLVIDPNTDTIQSRVALEAGAFVAHVELMPDGTQAFVSGTGSSRIYRVNLTTMTRLDDVVLPGLRGPHGLKLSDDGMYLFSANTDGTVSEIHAAAGAVLREFDVPGPALQVALSDTAVFASIVTPPAVVRIDRASGVVTKWDLPAGTLSTAAIAVAPDGTVLVSEQGDALMQGNRLFRLDSTTGAVTATYEVGRGAHGLALTPDGHRAYVTGTFDQTMAVVDLEEGRTLELARTDRGPAGVALWYAARPD